VVLRRARVLLRCNGHSSVPLRVGLAEQYLVWGRAWPPTQGVKIAHHAEDIASSSFFSFLKELARVGSRSLQPSGVSILPERYKTAPLADLMVTLIESRLGKSAVIQ
jgi:hypothetical protein